MQRRLPVILSVTALTVALLGTTPVGRAAHELTRAIPGFAKTAGYARNAGAVDGIRASRTARAGYLVPLGSSGKFPASVGQAGPPGPPGPAGANAFCSDTFGIAAGATRREARLGRPVSSR